MAESENELIRQCQEGDKQAFGVLVRKYAGPAIGAATLMLGNRHEAQDASQEAFVRAWKSIKRFTGQAKFYTWFSTILRNICVDRLRKRKRRGPSAELHDIHEHTNPESNPVLLAQRGERQARVWRAIQQLSPHHREVIVMNHFLDMSYKDMAEALDVPFGTVTSRLHSARNALRQRLSGEADE